VRIALAAWLLAVLFAGCEERAKPSLIPLGEAAMPDQQSWRSTVTFSDSAVVKAVLWAGHIAVYHNRRETLLGDSIHVDFFDQAGRRTSTLTARRGRVDDQTRDFDAFENVVVTSDNGTVLRTDSLFWTNAERKIHTEAFVDIRSSTKQIRGHGLVSDQSLKNYRIFRVTGQAVTDGSQSPTP
jgi:LPS export ABC transporter protein LptC